MTVSPLDSELFAGLVSDAETAALFEDRAQIRSMLAVEAALARAGAKLGVIPGRAAERIARTADGLDIAPADLAEATASAGVPVPALVEALRQAVGGKDADYVHWGATSQDILDTALGLRLRTALEIDERRLAALIAALAARAEAHRATVMVARTRSQQATPTTFGLKVAGWLAPLLRHRARLRELRPRLLVVSFGGAAGTLAALGDRGLEVARALADELALGAPPGPWHTQRDGLADLAGWLSLVTGSLGKMGQDVLLLAQGEVGELREGAGGGSSTMPQKANPVAAEALVSAARMNAGLLAVMHHAVVQEHERGGAAWQLEWMSLPQMVVLTGAALGRAIGLVAGLEVDAERMRANLEASNGLVLAEAASFALARHMPRAEAQALVMAACREAVTQRRHLVDLLAERVDFPLDWDALRDPRAYLGEAERIVERIVRAAGSETD